MSFRKASKGGSLVYSLIETEHSQKWQSTYLPIAAGAEPLKAIPWKQADCQRTVSFRQLSETMVQEYDWMKDLGDAENGLFNFSPELSYGQVLLRDVVSYYRFSAIGRSKHFVLKCTSKPIFLMTDVILFRRVIGEMLKNALEGSNDNQTVVLSCRAAKKSVEIAVHNEKAIPELIQGSIFRHSISSKGVGRGYGTYCVKLFSEKYLGGKVSFTTSPVAGTTFTLKMPQLSANRKFQIPGPTQCKPVSAESVLPRSHILVGKML
jgi:nitrogen fixation/metabolism regulation signal transduction histidine kinase